VADRLNIGPPLNSGPSYRKPAPSVKDLQGKSVISPPEAMFGHGLPVRLSFDHDPQFEFQCWQANRRVWEVEAVQTVPCVPWSHPSVERFVETIRREPNDYPPKTSAT
jgi:hypothetical protein